EILKGKDKVEPFLVCSKWDESIVTYQTLKRDGAVPLLPVFSSENNDYNSGLGWKMFIKPSLLTSSYYLAFIHIGEKTGFKIIQHLPNSTQLIQWPAQKRLEWYWPMDEVAAKQQDNILFVAVQRTAIDADEINQQLTTRFANMQPFKILAMRDYLITQFSGYYAFTYHSIIDDSSCLEPLY
ncbi:MAG: hypothetical protein KAG86_10725, partial [Gammaproteobacteria bacterium]|nr:hypothetical protein [Gammaproteobacteria bacterium]